MVNCKSWNEFFTQSLTLLSSHPDRTRMTVKYRPADRQYTIKVTDDYQTLKYYTDSSSDLKQIHKLHNIYITLLCTHNVIDNDGIEKVMKDVESVSTSTADDRKHHHQQQKKKRRGKQ
jgi:hypothetical protein